MLLIGIQSAFGDNPNPMIFEALAMSPEEGKAAYSKALITKRMSEINNPTNPNATL